MLTPQQASPGVAAAAAAAAAASSSSSSTARPASDVKLPPIRSLPHFDNHLRSSSSSSSMQKLPPVDVASTSSSPTRPRVDAHGEMAADQRQEQRMPAEAAASSTAQRFPHPFFDAGRRNEKPVDEQRGSSNEMESRLAHVSQVRLHSTEVRAARDALIVHSSLIHSVPTQALHDLNIARTTLEQAMSPVENVMPSLEAIASARDAAGQAWYVLNSLSGE